LKQKTEEETVSKAALKIQALYKHLKYKKALKEMREKLKTLPYVCRSSFVKMQELKLSTLKLSSDMSKLKK
jgi:hypothetical protein